MPDRAPMRLPALDGGELPLDLVGSGAEEVLHEAELRMQRTCPRGFT